MEEVRPHRSVSQLNKYKRCPEEYRLSYVDKTPTNAPAAWLAQGSAFHETIQLWEESGRSPEVDIGRTYAVSYEQQIESMKARQPDLKSWLHGPRVTTEDDIQARLIKGMEQVRNYVQYALSNDFVIADIDEFNLAVEVPFEVEIGTTLIKGAIDLVILRPDGYEVRDLKTGNRETGGLQLGVYKFALEKIFGWPVVAASYYYAKDNKVVTLSKTELERYSESYLIELFDALNRGIENNVYIPNPGGHCILCPVKKYCREMGSSPIPLTTKGDGTL